MFKSLPCLTFHSVEWFSSFQLVTESIYCISLIANVRVMFMLQSRETREVIQFHYTSWPDFGVPTSPGAFLDFLWAVRASGALDTAVHGPPVIHCSAGIGRSGTFCLVDACLVLVR